MSLKKTVASLLSVAWIAVAVHAETVTVTNTEAMGAGSLAAAIEEANADASLTTIEFNIPGGGFVDGIALPVISSEVNIDGNNKATGDVVLEGRAPNGPGLASGLVFVRGSHNSKVDNVSTEGFLNAIQATSNGKITISNSTFTDAMSRAILLEYNEGSQVINNTFQGDAPLSAVITNSRGVSFLGNSVKAGEMQVFNSQYITVGATGDGNGNTFDGNGTQAAIFANNLAYSNIVNNTVVNQAAEGIVLTSSGMSNISSNTLNNNKNVDILADGGGQNQIYGNKITGDQLAHEAGITVKNNSMTSVSKNIVDGGRITFTDVQMGIVGQNTIKNDPFGFSGSGAVVINTSLDVRVTYNSITDNAGHGVLINDASHGLVFGNTITGNGRTGIKAINGEKNRFTQNIITDQNAAAGNGKNSISLVGTANNQKAAPVITSAVRTGDEIHVSGTTEGLTDNVEIFISSESDKGIALLTDAKSYATEANAVDGKWAAVFNTADLDSSAATAAELYLTATATDKDDNSSELSVNEKLVMTAGIAGSASVTAGTSISYEVPSFPGVSYQWWLGGDAAVTSGNGTNKITAVFNTAGTVVPVNVSYSDPVEGWVTKKLTVTVD